MKIVVLMGGLSSEREVSLSSGREICAALKLKGHEVVELDIRDALNASVTGAFGSDNRGLRGLVSNPEMASGELVFVALHGGAGEDGTVQALLDIMGKPYTGSGMLSSSVPVRPVGLRPPTLQQAITGFYYWIVKSFRAKKYAATA